MIDLKKLPIFRKLTDSQYEILTYFIVGGWNTLFGMGLYALAYSLLGRTMHYLILAIPVNILAITNAFLCYKLFVFRTKGNWLSECFRCYLVYGGGTLLSMGGLFLLVHFGKFNPMIANAVVTLVIIIGSFFGHKYFSFRQRKDLSEIK